MPYARIHTHKHVPYMFNLYAYMYIPRITHVHTNVSIVQTHRHGRIFFVCMSMWLAGVSACVFEQNRQRNYFFFPKARHGLFCFFFFLILMSASLLVPRHSSANLSLFRCMCALCVREGFCSFRRPNNAYTWSFFFPSRSKECHLLILLDMGEREWVYRFQRYFTLCTFRCSPQSLTNTHVFRVCDAINERTND